MRLIITLLTLLVLTSCGQDQLNKRTPSSSGTSATSECVCTFEFNPVCSNGITYDNPCIAKCQGVKFFSSGACGCNSKSGKVCATPPMPPCAPGMMCAQVMPSNKTYENECDMKKAKAHFIKTGPCN